MTTPRPPDASSVTDAPAEPDEAELLIDGQEEVFSRSEVELGRIEHGCGSRSGQAPAD